MCLCNNIDPEKCICKEIKIKDRAEEMFTINSEVAKIKKEFQHPDFIKVLSGLDKLVKSELSVFHFSGGFYIRGLTDVAKAKLVIEYIEKARPDEFWFEDEMSLALWWD